MKFSGYIMLILAWGTILSLCVYCFYRVFKEHK